MYANSAPNVRPPARAYPRNARSRSSSPIVCTVRASPAWLRRSAGSVSGRATTTSSASSPDSTVSSRKMPSHEVSASSCPPITGREDRAEPGHEHQRREQARGRRAGAHVAHHRARDHDPAGAGQPLHEAQPDQHAHARGARAQQRRQRVGQHRHDQRQAAAEPVAERPEQQLPEREPGDAGGQRELDGRRAGVQRAGDLRERRQVHVDRQRADRVDRPEHDDEPGDAGHRVHPTRRPELRRSRVRLPAWPTTALQSSRSPSSPGT